MSATGKPIEVVGQPTWTPEALAALADMAVRDLTQPTPETADCTPDEEKLAA